MKDRKREPPRQRKPLPPLLRKEGSYRSALDRLRRAEDHYGKTIWIEKQGHDGKPEIYYRYDSNGRLMKHTRTLYGYDITVADYTRFGEDTQIDVEKRRPTYDELR